MKHEEGMLRRWERQLTYAETQVRTLQEQLVEAENRKDYCQGKVEEWREKVEEK